ncbi:MAG: glycosyl hydrolase family 28 protein [Saccharofermentanales bacterium]
MKLKTILASSVANLDSDVYTGGGTNDTQALQRVLDMSRENDGIHLIMDGAALVTGLTIHSNTTIECLSYDCGFFQSEQSNCAIITNSNWDLYALQTRNISLIGGTYNQDSFRQSHHIPTDGIHHDPWNREEKGVYTLEFYGIRNLIMRDLCIRNNRTYALNLAGWQDVTIENINLDLPDLRHRQNQDGLHFYGPGKHLMIRNLSGRTGDDIINLSPDEIDLFSSITDVLIDGVFLDECDYGIHMLSRGTGRLDRVTVRNVTGSCRSFAFRVNCFYPDKTYGDFGNIVFENIDIRLLPIIGGLYEPASLFRIGGNIECLTLRNIRLHQCTDNRTLFEIGRAFFDSEFEGMAGYCHPDGLQQHINTIIIDDLTILEDSAANAGTAYIKVFCSIDNMILRNITVLHSENQMAGQLLIYEHENDKVPAIKRLIMDNVYM